MFTLLMALQGKRYLDTPTFVGCAVLSLVAALGLFVVPTMMFSILFVIVRVAFSGLTEGL